MECALRDEQTHVLRFDRGEDVIESLRAYCEHQGIRGGSFTAIGSARKVTLAWYDVETRGYQDTTIQGKLEVDALMGTVATKDAGVVVHAHGTVSDERAIVQGGHVKELVVGATCEVALVVFSSALTRRFDERTGLNLLAAVR